MIEYSSTNLIWTLHVVGFILVFFISRWLYKIDIFSLVILSWLWPATILVSLMISFLHLLSYVSNYKIKKLYLCISHIQFSDESIKQQHVLSSLNYSLVFLLDTGGMIIARNNTWNSPIHTNIMLIKDLSEDDIIVLRLLGFTTVERVSYSYCKIDKRTPSYYFDIPSSITEQWLKKSKECI